MDYTSHTFGMALEKNVYEKNHIAQEPFFSNVTTVRLSEKLVRSLPMVGRQVVFTLKQPLSEKWVICESSEALASHKREKETQFLQWSCKKHQAMKCIPISICTGYQKAVLCTLLLSTTMCWSVMIFIMCLNCRKPK